MDVPELYRLAEKKNIPVVTYPLPYNGSVSVVNSDGSCCIGMDEIVRDGDVLERVHLAHELGHCLTGSFYTIHAPLNHRQRHENRADKWAIRSLIPVSELDDAVAQGCTDLWALAERFGVTEQFMKKAVCLYVHGNVSSELYF